MKLKFNTEIRIGTYSLSSQDPVFVIAEAGVNHNGKMDLAFKLIDVAAEAGAHAVKFQAFKTEELILPDVEKASYQKQTTDSSESQFNMLKKLEVNQKQFLELKAYCAKKNIMFLVTPFDEVSLEELDALNVDAYKVASTDITNLPFLKRIAKKGKPVILSTGMSYLEEVELALQEIHAYNKNVILLHCTGNYPVPENEVNLNVLHTFAEKFDILTGYSDHTVGIGASPYAVAFGAKVLEKHFTLDKGMEGPDHRASLSPEELMIYMKEVKKVETMMGSFVKRPQLSETETRASLQKSFVAKQKIKKGEPFSDENIIAKRCGGKGLSPVFYHQIVGKIAARDFAPNEVIHL